MDQAADAPGWQARRLLRAARSATLATSAAGQPFATLVTPATAPDGAILLLLSDLSEHTRHLRADPRCAVLVAGQADGPNPQTAPRLTVTGLATPVDDPALRARWVALHPYAAFYADFGDFHLWRITPMAALFVAGFARAHRLQGAALQVDAAAIAMVADGIIAECNRDHPAALAALAGGAGAGQMVGIDPDGCDLVQGDRTCRVHWSASVANAGDLQKALFNRGLPISSRNAMR